jgi:TPR repeat protein
MKKIILLLTLITTINFASNPFESMRNNTQLTQAQTSQKVMYAKSAAAQGNSRAQFDLGLMYAQGNGVVKNERLAFNYFHKAARNKHVEAKFYMGLSFAQGRGVKKQTQLARYWFKLAAKAGHSKAMAHLASIEKTLRPQYAQNRRVAFNSQR